MQPLSLILIVKIVVTLFAWCIPLLLLPCSALAAIGFDVPQPAVFLRLLGMSYAALAVAYWFGLRAQWRGTYPAGTVWVGIVSNGGALLLLVLAAVQDVWTSWGILARGFMWGSLLATGLITLGLVVYGPLRSKPLAEEQK
jgi:hypothetical protein